MARSALCAYGCVNATTLAGFFYPIKFQHKKQWHSTFCTPNARLFVQGISALWGTSMYHHFCCIYYSKCVVYYWSVESSANLQSIIIIGIFIVCWTQAHQIWFDETTSINHPIAVMKCDTGIKPETKGETNLILPNIFSASKEWQLFTFIHGVISFSRPFFLTSISAQTTLTVDWTLSFDLLILHRRCASLREEYSVTTSHKTKPHCTHLIPIHVH